jgi:hypothetical protein
VGSDRQRGQAKGKIRRVGQDDGRSAHDVIDGSAISSSAACRRSTATTASRTGSKATGFAGNRTDGSQRKGPGDASSGPLRLNSAARSPTAQEQPGKRRRGRGGWRAAARRFPAHRHEWSKGRGSWGGRFAGGDGAPVLNRTRPRHQKDRADNQAGAYGDPKLHESGGQRKPVPAIARRRLRSRATRRRARGDDLMASAPRGAAADHNNTVFPMSPAQASAARSWRRRNAPRMKRARPTDTGKGISSMAPQWHRRHRAPPFSPGRLAGFGRCRPADQIASTVACTSSKRRLGRSVRDDIVPQLGQFRLERLIGAVASGVLLALSHGDNLTS